MEKVSVTSDIVNADILPSCADCSLFPPELTAFYNYKALSQSSNLLHQAIVSKWVSC